MTVTRHVIAVTIGSLGLVGLLAAAIVSTLPSESLVVVRPVGLPETAALSTHHVTVLEFDPNSGVSVGRVSHSPIRFRKRIDTASVPLMSAMLNRSMISALVLDYFRPDPLTAGRRRYYVVTLSDAHVVAMRTELRYSPQLVAAGAEGSEWVDVVFREKQVEVLNDLPPGPPDGDANGDGRIDLRDAAAFQRCMGATASLYPTCITAFDLDGSAGTDIGDWSAFSTAMLGP